MILTWARWRLFTRIMDRTADLLTRTTRTAESILAKLKEPILPTCTLIRDPATPIRPTAEESAPDYVPQECGRIASRVMVANGETLDEYLCDRCFDDMAASGSPLSAIEEIWHLLS